MRKKHELIIPIEKVSEGIDLSLLNALQFCQDAKVVLKGSCEHALGLCLFAIEELGKAELLQQLRNSAIRNDEKTVILRRGKPQEFFCPWVT